MLPANHLSTFSHWFFCLFPSFSLILKPPLPLGSLDVQKVISCFIFHWENRRKSELAHTPTVLSPPLQSVHLSFPLRPKLSSLSQISNSAKSRCSVQKPPSHPWCCFFSYTQVKYASKYWLSCVQNMFNFSSRPWWHTPLMPALRRQRQASRSLRDCGRPVLHSKFILLLNWLSYWFNRFLFLYSLSIIFPVSVLNVSLGLFMSS